MADDTGSSFEKHAVIPDSPWMGDDPGSSSRDFVRGALAPLTRSAAAMFQRLAPTPVITPCIGICTLGPDGLCDGCFRTGDEIAQWSQLPDLERLAIMNEVLPAREATRT